MSSGRSRTPANEAIAHAAQDVADGRAVDWVALGNGLQGTDQIEQVDCLRIIGAIAALHRSGGQAADSSQSTALIESSPASRASQGEPWGRYRLLEQVGSGSFGSVYRAWDPELEFEIAIKILHRHVRGRPAEVAAAARGTGARQGAARQRRQGARRRVARDRVGLCMEFVRGETLETAVRRGQR